jgi:hypothetical protein
MTDIKTREGALFTVDRDYMGSIGEDVQFLARAEESNAPADVAESLTPDEARALAAALIHHADEVDQINKELA